MSGSFHINWHSQSGCGKRLCYDLKILKQISKNAINPITTKTPYLAGSIYLICVSVAFFHGVACAQVFCYFPLQPAQRTKLTRRGASAAWSASSAEQSCF